MQLKLKTIQGIFIFCSAVITTSFFLLNAVYAQNAISLSITPPLFELMIQPGKEVKQIYTITNDGGDTILTPRIVYFENLDEEGNVSLIGSTAPPEWVKYNKNPISLKNGAKTNFNVIFSPPIDTEETDHFLTLVFSTGEPVDILDQNSSLYKTEIGTNILVTVSKDGNPKKSAEIVEFKAPRVIDSLFGKIEYIIKLRNNGNSYWKPNGKIISGAETLNLAQVNVISGSTRRISCLENENLISCELKNKYPIGKITSSLEFLVDDDPKVYKLEAVTYAFPLSLVFLVLFLLTMYRPRGIFKIWQRRK